MKVWASTYRVIKYCIVVVYSFFSKFNWIKNGEWIILYKILIEHVECWTWLLFVLLFPWHWSEDCCKGSCKITALNFSWWCLPQKTAFSEQLTTHSNNKLDFATHSLYFNINVYLIWNKTLKIRFRHDDWNLNSERQYPTWHQQDLAILWLWLSWP